MDQATCKLNGIMIGGLDSISLNNPLDEISLGLEVEMLSRFLEIRSPRIVNIFGSQKANGHMEDDGAR